MRDCRHIIVSTFVVALSFFEFTRAGERVQIEVPSTSKVGESVTFTCKFNLDGVCESCFSVFWTKGQNIMVYNPYIGERRSSGVKGIEISGSEIKRAGRPDHLDFVSTLTLSNVNEATSGQICCRVMGGAQWEEEDCGHITVA